ncbi:juvenile hormone esterase-like [Phlebotomus argentipes]|uniref:juvenile hormone esterase-like n=1 Tax=Phlebotomus argentipes TaxID=94469 RepID=UPI0028933B76|nr:juvenile hormone esterase-like [Phlebotomus argentipes]
MVFFHGGGFMSGDGGKTLYGPDYLLDQDVILVSGNYRLGIFGFLSTNTLDCPGNFGMKDQVEILKWVQKNIGQFGGDKDSVTIFGESAGGASVTYHTISPLSKGLFHRAIPQSGTHLSLWAKRDGEIIFRNARKFASLVKCPADRENAKEMIECLRNLSAKEIMSHFYEVFKWDIFPICYWVPVVEPESENAFLTEDPAKLSGGDDIPFLIGITSNEGIFISVALLRDQKLIEHLKREIKHLLPDLMSYQDYNEVTRNTLTNMISEFYFQNHEVDLRDSEMLQNFTDSMSDAYFLNAVSRILRQRSPESLSSNTFLYLFNHMGENSFSELFLEDSQTQFGVSHMDDLIYLFPVVKEHFFKGIPTETDDFIRKTMVSLWVNFAKFGNPTPKSDDSSLPEWKVAGSFPYDFLRIGNYHQSDAPIIAMENGLYEKRVLFWKKIASVLTEAQMDVD